MRHCDWAFGLLLLARPMHSPELCPVHGMPLISGRPPTGEVLVNSGEFGTISGTQILVNWSSVSPPAHAVIDGDELPIVGTANICDRWGRSDRDSESPRKDQSSSWKVEGRHRHAFCSLLAYRLGSERMLPAT